jgi:hypothetical protein
VADDGIPQGFYFVGQCFSIFLRMKAVSLIAVSTMYSLAKLGLSGSISFSRFGTPEIGWKWKPFCGSVKYINPTFGVIDRFNKLGLFLTPRLPSKHYSSIGGIPSGNHGNSAKDWHEQLSSVPTCGL